MSPQFVYRGILDICPIEDSDEVTNLAAMLSIARSPLEKRDVAKDERHLPYMQVK